MFLNQEFLQDYLPHVRLLDLEPESKALYATMSTYKKEPSKIFTDYHLLKATNWSWGDSKNPARDWKPVIRSVIVETRLIEKYRNSLMKIPAIRFLRTHLQAILARYAHFRSVTQVVDGKSVRDLVREWTFPDQMDFIPLDRLEMDFEDQLKLVDSRGRRLDAKKEITDLVNKIEQCAYASYGPEEDDPVSHGVHRAVSKLIVVSLQPAYIFSYLWYGLQQELSRNFQAHENYLETHKEQRYLKSSEFTVFKIPRAEAEEPVWHISSTADPLLIGCVSILKPSNRDSNNNDGDNGSPDKSINIPPEQSLEKSTASSPATTRSVYEDPTAQLFPSSSAATMSEAQQEGEEDPRGCAIGKDGKLKDAKHIEWFTDPDDPSPMKAMTPLDDCEFTVTAESVLLFIHISTVYPVTPSPIPEPNEDDTTGKHQVQTANIASSSSSSDRARKRSRPTSPSEFSELIMSHYYCIHNFISSFCAINISKGCSSQCSYPTHTSVMICLSLINIL